MSFWWLVLLTVMNHVSFKGVKVLVTLDALHLGAQPFAVGLLFAAFSLLPAGLAVFAGRVSDRYGPRGPMLLGSGGLAAGLLLCFLLPGLVTLYVAVLVIGGCYIFYTVAGQHLVGAWGDAASRTRHFSYYAMGNSLTALIGPPLAGISIDTVGYTYTYLVLAALPLFPVAFLFYAGRRLPRPKVAPVAGPRPHSLELLTRPALVRALVVSGIIETGMELFNFYMPLYGHSIGLSATRIGVVIGAFGGAMLLSRALLPYWTRRAGEERVLAVTLMLGAVTLLGFPFVREFGVLIALSIAFGLGLGCCTPLAMMLTYSRAPEGRTGEAMGLRQTFNKLTEIFVPVVFGSIGSAFGLGPAFYLTAALLGGGAFMMRGEARSAAAR
ncbi:MAG: MFS transporter [Burkholderiales bacterium]